MTSWKTSDIELMSCWFVWARTSTPPTLMEPESTSQKRAMSLASVDLPPPEGPTSAVTVPGRQVRLTSSMTGVPGSYEKDTFFSSMSERSAVNSAGASGSGSSPVDSTSSVDRAAWVAA